MFARSIFLGFSCVISSYGSAMGIYYTILINPRCGYDYMLSLTEFQKMDVVLMLDTYTLPFRAFKLLTIIILNSLSDSSNISVLSESSSDN